MARQFGLTEDFVRHVLEGIERPPDQDALQFRTPRVSFDFLARLWISFVRSFDWVTHRPTMFVAVTSAMCVALGIGLSVMPDLSVPSVRVFSLEIEDSILLLGILVTFGLHMACYFHRRMARYALYGGLVV
ncbi:MAG TPA: hypothetical protein VGE01_02555, partial [Fimbriimonas sp.]